MLSGFLFVVSQNMVLFCIFTKCKVKVYVYEQSLGNQKYLFQKKSSKGTKRASEHCSESNPEGSHTPWRVSSSNFCSG